MSRKDKRCFQDCIFFLQKKCNQGANCPFRHLESARCSPYECRLFQEGKCKNVCCPYRHIKKYKIKASPISELKPGGCQRTDGRLQHQQPMSPHHKMRLSAHPIPPTAASKDKVIQLLEDCIYFLQNRCDKGEDCPFRHSEAARSSPIECKFFQEGRCTTINCTYRHIKKNEQKANCAFEMKPGGCRKPDCSFQHQQPKVPQLVMQKTSQQSVLLDQSKNTKYLEDCTFFISGTCLKGKDCPFRHNEAAKKTRTECLLFKEGKCDKVNCILRHIKKDVKVSNKLNSEIVWEWRNDDDTEWESYSQDASDFIEKEYQKDIRQLDLSTHNTSLPYKLDLQKMIQVRKETGRQRNINRKEIPKKNKKSETMCVWEFIEGGCKNPKCLYMHMKDQKYIVWEWRNDEDTAWRKYDPDISDFIENGYKNGKEKLDLSTQDAQLPYNLDLEKMIQVRKETGRERKINRQLMDLPKTFSDVCTKLEIPKSWLPHTELIVKVSADTSEYKEISSLFSKALSRKIISISRVQNPTQWNFYSLRKREMEKNLGADLNEKRLFHGTKPEVIDCICENNFDFRNSGLANGAAYGQGTYFGIEASLSDGYTRPTSQGIRSMFVAKVLCGKWTNGTSSMRKPPPINSSNPNGPAYNSCVNTTSNPSMVIIFDYSQCYPEYIIEYTS